MSDTGIVIHLLRKVERRLRATQLQEELTRGLSVTLVFLIGLKIWDLFSPLRTATIALGIAGGLSFAGYVLWCLWKKGSLYRAAASIDRKASLNDEITTALWFIDHPLASEWVESQIHRAARNAEKIDAVRAYPSTICRPSYAALALILVFAGLNFAPRVAPVSRPTQAVVTTGEQAYPPHKLDVGKINAGLDEIAARFQQSERLRGVAQALTDRRLNLAAEELRKVAARVSDESKDATQEIQESFEGAARNPTQELQTLAEGLAQTARAMQNKDTTAIQEAIEEVAGELEDLEEEIYTQESTLDQLAKGNERRAEQDGHVSGAPIPQPRAFPQAAGSTDGFGASGGKVEAGPREGPPTTLAVKLQQESLRGMPTASAPHLELEQASRQERSKLDYRNVKSELNAAQKDALRHQSMPWKYRPLIKDYFKAILQSAKTQ